MTNQNTHKCSQCNEVPVVVFQPPLSYSVVSKEDGSVEVATIVAAGCFEHALKVADIFGLTSEKIFDLQETLLKYAPEDSVE